MASRKDKTSFHFNETAYLEIKRTGIGEFNILSRAGYALIYTHVTHSAAEEKGLPTGTKLMANGVHTDKVMLTENGKKLTEEGARFCGTKGIRFATFEKLIGKAEEDMVNLNHMHEQDVVPRYL